MYTLLRTFAKRSGSDIMVHELPPHSQHDSEGGVVRVARPVDRHAHISGARQGCSVHSLAGGAHTWKRYGKLL